MKRLIFLLVSLSMSLSMSMPTSRTWKRMLTETGTRTGTGHGHGHGHGHGPPFRWSNIVDRCWKNGNDEATFCLQDRTLKRWSDIIASKCLILKRSSYNFASKIQNVRRSDNVESSDHDRKIALSELRPPLFTPHRSSYFIYIDDINNTSRPGWAQQSLLSWFQLLFLWYP